MIRSVLTITLVSVITVIGFQNCGNSVRLSKVDGNSHNNVPPKDIGQFCGPDGIEKTVPQNLLVVLDMSSSNTSLLVSDAPDDPYGIPQRDYQLGPAAYARCLVESPTPAVDCNPPTDSDAAGNGRRFAALNNYLNNLTCPQNTEPTNRYGVIGFSTAILQAPGFRNRSCEDQLTDKTIALDEINSFANLQRQEVGRGRVWAHAYPFQMYRTSYRSALQCLDDRIRNDLNPDSIQRSYKVLFITDGKPTDTEERVYKFPPGRYVPIPLWEEYGAKLDTMKKFLTGQGFNFVFQPIYYGLPDERAEAINNLDKMALTVAPGISTIELDPTSMDFTASLTEAFCKSPSEKVKVGYSSYGGVQVIPLTSSQIDEQIFADQDMDGIIDIEEDGATFSPTLSHSRALLDSLCYRYRMACETFETTYAANNSICDRNLAYGLGFNQCDQKFMDEEIIRVQDALGRKPFSGIDDDGDGILSYFEFIKGTDPLDPDVDLDPDIDGFSTRAEIMQGTDPFSSTSETTRRTYRHSLTFSPATSCLSGVGFKMGIEAMPVLDVEELSESRIVPHQKNENVFALVYFVKPVAYSTRTLNVFVRYLKVMNNANQTTTIGPQIDLGEVLLP